MITPNNPYGNFLDLFYTPSGKPYATLDVKGHRERGGLGKKGFHYLLDPHFYQSNRKTPSENMVKVTLRALEGQAHVDRHELQMHFRIAGLDDKIYVDLANVHWQAVELQHQLSQWK